MNHHRIDYIEFPAKDLQKTKQFYTNIFDWNFTDYGPHYTSFMDGRLAGGFTTELKVSQGGVLIVIYSEKLNETMSKIKENGGVITKNIFDFPGGKRFHFTDPNGNELAVWSDK